jgi:OmpA-OmpF porin, OOP family
MILRDDKEITAELGDQSAYIIEQRGAGVANIDGASFTVEENCSGSCNGRDDQIILDGKGGGTWNPDRMG